MRVTELEAEIVTDIKGDIFPVANFDAELQQTIIEILSKPPVVVTFPEPNVTQLPFNGSYHHMSVGEKKYVVRQAGREHRRSFVIEHGELPETITDEYGNIFSSFTIKGGNLSSPGLIATATANHELIAYGLQEAYASRRILRASDILRKNGVGTEYVMAMSEPLNLPIPDTDKFTDEHELVGRNEYTRRIINQYWEGLDEEKRTLEALAELRKNHKKTAYMLTFRGMDSEFRLSEITNDKNVFNKMLEHHGLDTDMSMEEFLKQVFVPTLATNLAKMHQAGLCHRYLNPINVTALGSIVDLDGVKGEPLGLGDEPITLEEMAYDLTYLISSADNGSAYARIIFSTGIDAAEELCMGLLTNYMEAVSEQNQQDSSFVGKIAVVISKQIQSSRDPFSIMYKDSLTARLQEQINQYLDSSINDINREVQSYFDDDKIDSLAESLNDVMAEKMHQIADFISTDLFNEQFEDIKNGDIKKAITELFEKFGLQRQSIIGVIRPEVVKIVNDELGSQYAHVLEKVQGEVLADSVDKITDRLLENHGEEMIDRLCVYLKDACIADSELIGAGQLILTVGADNKFVYVSEYTPTSDLIQAIGDKELPLSIRTFEDVCKSSPVKLSKEGMLSLKEGGRLFIGDDFYVHEIVFFGNDNDSIQNWGREDDGVLKVELLEPESGIFLIVGEDKQGIKKYILVAEDENMVAHLQAQRDGGKVLDEEVLSRPVYTQSEFFDASEYDDTPIRLKDYFGSKKNV